MNSSCGSAAVEMDIYQIIQGGTTYPPMIARLWDDSIDDPYDLTDVTEITTCFKNNSGPDLVLTFSDDQIEIVGNPVLGKIKITLTAAQTALLALVEGATLEISVIKGSADPVKFRILNAYSVIESDC